MTIKEIYEVIIVGGGPAGLTAGLYSQRAALKTVLFEKGLPGGQIAISKNVENYPGLEEITGFDLAEKMLRHARNFGLQVVQQEVAEISAGPDLHSVRLANGDLFQTLALILAAGGSVRKLGIPGEAEYLGSGVSYCATCDGFFFRDKTVIVIGGGDTAVEEALYLSKLTKKVTPRSQGLYTAGRQTTPGPSYVRTRDRTAPEHDYYGNQGRWANGQCCHYRKY